MDAQKARINIQEGNSDGIPFTEVRSDGDVDLAKVLLLIEGWHEKMKERYLADMLKD